MSGIYIHFPFCTSKCNYCDFYVITNKKLVNGFLDNLKKEILLSSDILNGKIFDSVFLGGGTPSLLSAIQIQSLIDCLKDSLTIDSNPEITLESNPEDFYVNRSKLSELRQAGINRISLGIQSFINSELKYLSRNHDSEMAYSVLCEVLNVFGNASIDLIYTVPGQTSDTLRSSLDLALKTGVPHISAYTLTIEKNTLLGRYLRTGKVEKKSSEKEAELFRFLSDYLINNGYDHYEISNYAKPGYESRHNMKYWECLDYIGYGPSAHSFINGTRWNNTDNIVGYNISLGRNILPRENIHIQSSLEKSNDYIMCSLRSKGISVKRINRIYGSDYFRLKIREIEDLISKDYIIFTDGRYRLTEKGFLLADEIILKLML